jgi:phenylpropionate dioxygenase-like ring-hydroxylating dioxygenase large terminal subunit
MYIKNCWYVAAWDHELSGESLMPRKLLNQPIVFFRKANGAVVALEDRCCHRSAPLSMGKREGDNLRCGYHGLKYDSAGHCIEIPGQMAIPDVARVRSYPAIERHSWIWVWMGDAAKADPALIPAAVGFDDPNYILRGGQMDYDANYQLVNDNLCDFSHVSFVHESSFRVMEYSESLPQITRLPRGIRVQRWLHDPPNKPDFVPAGDTWQIYDYLAPGVLLMSSALYPTGTAANFTGAPTGIEPLHANFSSQAITPMTDTTSRYFYSMGPRSCEKGAEDLADLIGVSINKAFAEDKRMIEAQQRTINELGFKSTPIRHDSGPVQMRRVMERLAEEESSAAT